MKKLLAQRSAVALTICLVLLGAPTVVADPVVPEPIGQSSALAEPLSFLLQWIVSLSQALGVIIPAEEGVPENADTQNSLTRQSDAIGGQDELAGEVVPIG